MVKPDGAQRESDGVVVPLIAGMNPVGGKGPDFGGAGNRGPREGMTGTARSNFPQSREAPDKVRRLQNRLWAAAKQSSGRRFHAQRPRPAGEVPWPSFVAEISHERHRRPGGRSTRRRCLGVDVRAGG